MPLFAYVIARVNKTEIQGDMAPGAISFENRIVEAENVEDAYLKGGRVLDLHQEENIVMNDYVFPLDDLTPAKVPPRWSNFDAKN